MRAWIGAALFALLLCAGAAGAGIVQVSSTGALAHPSYTVVHFDTGFGGIPAGVSFAPSSGSLSIGSASSWCGGVTPSGLYGLVTDASEEPLLIGFSNPVTSAGLWFGNDDWGNFKAVVEVYDGPTLLATLLQQANLNDWCDQFIGFNSTGVQVTQLRVRYERPGAQGLSVYIDDVYFSSDGQVGPQQVPEPATVVMLGLGGLALVRRRRRG